ncbi:acyltransferase [Leptolyngbya sp. FACHB-711]|uniref:acyltransferase n=1 Tax=Leptolyngbya sp. FACHB-711 TaxID=2692813 RepID=UPI0016837125|nr:acyltransferase [Leptolyngbya sp. FACHB-711]MBD2028212.1 acyltransferase [Leptolyngbya sp. FACHB-711]
MLQKIEGLKSRWRNLYYRSLGVKLKGYVWMRQIEIPRNFSDIEIEAAVALDRGVVLLSSGDRTAYSKIQIGGYTYINRNTFVDASLLITIGCHCAIGPNCYITDHDHGTNLDLPPLAQPLIAKPTHIGDRVWLGANVTVLKGVTIGADAVIGAGSVVTKDIPERVIAVGTPAKVLRYRDALTEPEQRVKSLQQ